MKDNKTGDARRVNMQSLNKQVKETAQETDDRLNAVEELVTDINTKFDKLTDMMEKIQPIMAKNTPHVIAKDGVDSRDVYQHLDETGIEFVKNDDPNIDAEVIERNFTSVNSAEFREKAEQMAFDNQEIEIMVMSSTSTYPDHTFMIGVNGRMRLIVRGTKQWLPRNYVEVLLRAKTSTYGNYESRNPMNNELEVKNPEIKSHRYPLQVLKDPSGALGSRWLQRVSNDMTA